MATGFLTFPAPNQAADLVEKKPRGSTPEIPDEVLKNSQHVAAPLTGDATRLVHHGRRLTKQIFRGRPGQATLVVLALQKPPGEVDFLIAEKAHGVGVRIVLDR